MRCPNSPRRIASAASLSILTGRVTTPITNTVIPEAATMNKAICQRTRFISRRLASCRATTCAFRSRATRFASACRLSTSFIGCGVIAVLDLLKRVRLSRGASTDFRPV